MGYLFLAIALTLNAFANVLIKLGSASFAAIQDVGVMRAVLLNYPLLGALVLFALNIGFHTLALSRLPLSVAYPIAVAGGLFIVTVSSVFYLREAVTLTQFFGILLLVVASFLIMVK